MTAPWGAHFLNPKEHTMQTSKDPQMIEILKYPTEYRDDYADRAQDANAVAVLIAIVGLLLALIGAAGLLAPVPGFPGWAGMVTGTLGTSTFFLGLILRFSRTD